MTKCLKELCVAISVVILFLPAFSDEETGLDNVFLHYQNIVQPRETGVYEDGDMLYIHVRIPFDRSKEKVKEKRARAIFAAQDLLKQWAIDYSAPERNREDNSPKGVKEAKNIVARYLPGWHFKEWPPRLSMREFPHLSADGFYVMGQAVAKDDVVRNIPKTFFKPFAAEDWNEALAKAIEAGIKKDGREAVLRLCRAWDASSHFVSPESAKDVDYSRVCESVRKYVAESERAAMFAQAAKKINGPHARERWDELPEPVSVSTNVIVSAKTNALEHVAVATNVTSRIQEKDEIADLGRSCGTTVVEREEVADVEEVVVTTTMTVIESCRIVRRRHVSSVSGNARFESLFAGGGEADNSKVAPTEFGSAAAKVFFEALPLAEKMARLLDAVRENPCDPRLWNLYGKCLQTEGDNLGAVVCFRNALRLDAEYEFALVNLAETYQALGYRRLAVGLAIFARAVAKDAWCVSHAEALLKKGE